MPRRIQKEFGAGNLRAEIEATCLSWAWPCPAFGSYGVRFLQDIRGKTPSWQMLQWYAGIAAEICTSIVTPVTAFYLGWKKTEDATTLTEEDLDHVEAAEPLPLPKPLPGPIARGHRVIPMCHLLSIDWILCFSRIPERLGDYSRTLFQFMLHSPFFCLEARNAKFQASGSIIAEIRFAGYLTHL